MKYMNTFIPDKFLNTFKNYNYEKSFIRDGNYDNYYFLHRRIEKRDIRQQLRLQQRFNGCRNAF